MIVRLVVFSTKYNTNWWLRDIRLHTWVVAGRSGIIES